MILDEKTLQFPPPPYYNEPSSSTATTSTFGGVTITALPSHLLLSIISYTFPETAGKFEGESRSVLHRHTLHWLHTSLRFVNRELYVACMHVLRSTYLSAYAECVRYPYTSDPFPSSVSPNTNRKGKSQIFHEHRELPVLDLFIALLAHEDFLQDSSNLHLTRDEAYKDIFDLTQPRSRLEDLVAEIGGERGVITGTMRATPSETRASSPPTSPIQSEKVLNESSPYTILASLQDDSQFTYVIPPTASQLSLQSTVIGSSVRSVSTPRAPTRRQSFFASLFKSRTRARPSFISLSSTSSFLPTPSPARCPQIKPLLFSTLSIAFSPRVVKLVYTPPPPSSRPTSPSYSSGSKPGSMRLKRTLVEVARSKDESLESSARQLVESLKLYLEEEAQYV